jgi:hypothetical protein
VTARGAVERVEKVVDLLCSAYSSTDAEDLLPDVRRYRDYILALRSSPGTIKEKRDLLLSAGWLSALLACLQIDIGDRAGAEANRRAAFSIGQETSHPEVVAWAVEMLAWVALIDERFRDAANAARAGQNITRIGTSAMVQLAVQEAKAWSQLRARHDAKAALGRAELALAHLPDSSTPEHHFVFDPSKLLFFAGTCYVWLGEDDPAEEHAREVITQGRAAGKLTRVAEAHIDLALVALHRGDLDKALGLATEALQGPRLCATTLGRLAEFNRALLSGTGDVQGSPLHDQYLLMVHDLAGTGEVKRLTTLTLE